MECGFSEITDQNLTEELKDGCFDKKRTSMFEPEHLYFTKYGDPEVIARLFDGEEVVIDQIESGCTWNFGKDRILSHGFQGLLYAMNFPVAYCSEHADLKPYLMIFDSSKTQGIKRINVIGTFQ